MTIYWILDCHYSTERDVSQFRRLSVTHRLPYGSMGDRLLKGAERMRYDETSRERSLIGIVVIGHTVYILLTRDMLRK